MAEPKKRTRRAYCAWCGADLGEAQSCFNEIESCGEPECEREVRGMIRADNEERRLLADADDYERYR